MNDRTDRIDELIALAALGELSESEELDLDALLAEDVEMTNELDEAVETAATLHGALTETPPARLKASVLAAIAAVPQVPSSASTAPAVDSDEPSVIAPVIDLTSRRRSRLVTALSAAAALVLLAGVGLVLVRDDSVSDQERIAAEAENVVAADDAVSRVLEGELEGTVTVVYSPGEQALVIDGEGLPVLGEDRAFVLWFVGDAAVTPVQTFRPDASGDVLVRVDDVDPTDFVLGITEEDAGGAEKPTLPILAAA